MKTCIFYVLVALCTLCSCSSGPKEPMIPEEMVKWFIVNGKAASAEVDENIITDSICGISEDKCFVFLMDASCSMCIYQFVEFYQLESQMCGTPVRVVIDSERMPQVEYILGKSGIVTDSDQLSFVENADSAYVRGRIENLDLSGTFMLVDEGEVKGTYLYLNSIQVDDN